MMMMFSPIGGHQLPATHGGAWRRPGQGAARRVHAEQHHCHRRGLGQTDHKFDHIARIHALVSNFREFLNAILKTTMAFPNFVDNNYNVSK